MDKKTSSLLVVIGGLLLLGCICSMLVGSVFLFGLMAVDPTPTPRQIFVPTSEPAAVETHSLEILNLSGLTICYLYMSETFEDWGPDQLKDNVIESGGRFTLYGIRSGVYDLRAETCGGTVVRRYGIRVYNDLEWTLYND